ncbi:MAG: hypothetical protein CL678_10425 [Bdellovibrionaceae bacterium]|nr:hypothetical protein [Pseudobdellovibrionaceae bacterium]|tara:strand:- start:1703 stop:3052 length:1350 start_codon:yes stop_codon:yes gene_type:complete
MKSNYFLFALVGVALGACDGGSITSHVPKDGAKYSQKHAEELSAAGEGDQAVEEFVRMGELFFEQGAFEFADQMFLKAQKIDSKNSKVLFYRALLGPVISMKGFVSLIEPLIQDGAKEGYYKSLDRVRNHYRKEIRDVVLEPKKGRSLFHSYGDLQQDLLSHLIPALENSVLLLDELSGKSFNVSIDLERFEAVLTPDKKGIKTYCTYGTYPSCHTSGKMNDDRSVSVNDISVIRHLFVSYLNLLRVETAYSLKGIRSLDQEDKKNPTEYVKMLKKKYPHFLKLNQNHQLKKVSADLLKSFKSIEDLYSRYPGLDGCKDPELSYTGLISSFCFLGNQKVASDLINVLMGPTRIKVGTSSLSNKDIYITVDISNFLNHPIADLKELLPMEFDSDGYPSSLPDPSFGGIMNDSDGYKILHEKPNSLKFHLFKKKRLLDPYQLYSIVAKAIE